MSLLLNDQSEIISRARHLNAGLQVFSDAASVQEASFKALNLINFAKHIQNDQDLVSLVEGLDINMLYLSLKQTEDEVLSEVLSCLSSEQFQQVMDREAWVDDEISLLKLKQWLSLASFSQPDQLPARFFAFEEEFQLAALSQKVVVCTQEEFENLQRGFQDKFTPLPGNEIYYAFINVSNEEEEFLNQLITQGLEFNLEYTMSLLLHAHSLPPGEQLLLATQFRRARMEEDGYVDFSESLDLFKPLAFSDLKQEILRRRGQADGQRLSKVNHFEEALPGLHVQGDFFDQVMDELRTKDLQSLDKSLSGALKNCQDQLIFIVNAASQVCKVEPSDLVKMKGILQGVKALLSLGLEILSEGRVSRGVELVDFLPLKSIFRFSHAVMHSYQKDILNSLMGLIDLKEKILKYHDAQKFGSLLSELEKAFAFVFHEPMYSLFVNQFNRFPCIPASFVQRKLPKDAGLAQGKKVSENANKFHLIATVRDAHILINETLKSLALLTLARSYGYDLGLNSNLDALGYLLSYLRETAAFLNQEKHPNGVSDVGFFKDLKETLLKDLTWQVSPQSPLVPTINFAAIAEEALSDLKDLLDFESSIISGDHHVPPKPQDNLGKEHQL